MPQVLARAISDPPRRRSTISAPRHRGHNLRRHKRAPLTAPACARAPAANHTMPTWRAAVLLERWLRYWPDGWHTILAVKRPR